MSLWFYLKKQKSDKEECICHCGNVHTHTYFETLFDINITHNLGRMAVEAGFYDCLWRPEESGFEFAHQIIEILENSLKDLVKDPEKYKSYNPKNGWGTYEGFIQSISKIIEFCKKYPNSRIESST